MEEVFLGNDEAWGGSAQPTMPSRSSVTPATQSQQAASLTTFPVFGTSTLNVTVSEPQKHGEGSGAFVNYLISTKTNISIYANTEMSIRRRFHDFVWLQKSLMEEHPSCILPPLPGKHRMEYLTGDRFSPEFIEKRRVSLQMYMDRISRHPILQKSQSLRKFLESNDLVHEPVAQAQKSNVFENLSDTLLNAFAKVRKPDERFTEFKEQLDKFEGNISTVEKLHAKLVKIQTELELDTLEFGGSLTTLGTMETQVTGPLTDFSNILRNVCSVLRDKINSEEIEYVSNIREYIGYCEAVKDVLKLRDQKQVDYEELSNYLQNHVTERDRTMNPQRGGGGLASFISNKYQELKGVDVEKARQTKLTKLSSKITELEDAVEMSDEVAKEFSAEVAKEIDFFQTVKLVDWKQYMLDYTTSQLEYYEKVV
ncbi:intercellular trafficking and secretion [Chytridiales sp. JEL 0842]|nr:intercellular trafficking and secretion [Chytridiales sp. JEL 0842]